LDTPAAEGEISMRIANRWRVWVGVLLGLGLIQAGLAADARAQAEFPRKPITILVNFGPGGGRDILARGVGKTLGRILGVPVVVVNKPGGGGAVGLVALAEAAPDGYTIGVGGTPEIIDQVLDKRDYDVRKFTYIGRVQSSPLYWFVRADSPIKTPKDFKTFGKPVRHGTFSLTAQQTVAAMIFATREGFPLVNVTGYQGSAPSLLALIRGEVEFVGTPESAARQFIDAGQIRPLVAIGEHRSPTLPNVPTVAESGLADLATLGLDLWLMGPPNLPRDRVQILEAALAQTLKDPEVIAWAKTSRIDLAPLSADATGKTAVGLLSLFEKYKADIERYVKK
jgi:tripartite-type tricarboxylate transporter receptor subunit TctC